MIQGGERRQGATPAESLRVGAYSLDLPEPQNRGKLLSMNRKLATKTACLGDILK